MAPHVRESFAYDLIDHLALLRRQHVFGPVARDLDPNRVEAGGPIRLRGQGAPPAPRSRGGRGRPGRRCAAPLWAVAPGPRAHARAPILRPARRGTLVG